MPAATVAASCVLTIYRYSWYTILPIITLLDRYEPKALLSVLGHSRPLLWNPATFWPAILLLKAPRPNSISVFNLGCTPILPRPQRTLTLLPVSSFAICIMKFCSIAVFGLLSLAGDALAQKTIKVMPFGASIVTVRCASVLAR